MINNNSTSVAVNVNNTSCVKQKIARKYINKAPSLYAKNRVLNDSDRLLNDEDIIEGEYPVKKIRRETAVAMEVSGSETHVKAIEIRNVTTDNIIGIFPTANGFPMTSEETIRKKLESMFSKNHAIKRRPQNRSQLVHHPPDGYTTIDSLLNQYGKKQQLNDTEIRHDINLLKDLSKSTSNTTAPRDDISGDNDDIFNSSAGKIEIQEEITPKSAANIDDEFKPTRYASRQVRNTTKMQTIRKTTSKKANKAALKQLEMEEENGGEELNMSDHGGKDILISNSVETSMTSIINTISTTNNNNVTSIMAANNINISATSSNSNNRRQLRSRRKPEQ
jgi:hypothetical protein